MLYKSSTNLYIFIIFLATLAFELLVTKLVGVSPALLWGFTIGIYSLFILYQVLVRINEETEKNKIKALLFELMDTINGIPIVNKDEKLIIKWDIIFKKLIDRKEYNIYDRIIKTNTRVIDTYVNKYPSLLIDDSVNLKEANYNPDLNSTIKGNSKKDEIVEEELTNDKELTRKLFIRDIKSDRASFSNYNSSIYFDVVVKKEYVPEKADELGKEHDPEYDGFSVWMMHNDKKYNVVPRIVLHKKTINKEKWFFDHINELLNCAAAIADGDEKQTLHVDEYNLMNYIEDMPDNSEPASFLRFTQLKDENLIFTGSDKNKIVTANCEFKTNNNRFEVLLKTVKLQEGDELEVLDIDKTVAIGSSFQPLVTILEKMPELVSNIERVINNQDISNIVIG